MHNKPLISIIVPVYNAEKYLSRCINSILLQSFQSFEVILIDDGSSDNSGLICDKFSVEDNRVRVLHTENYGVVHARERGVHNSCGEYIVFVDADDTLCENALSTMFFFQVEHDIDILVTAKHYIEEESSRLLLNKFDGYVSREVYAAGMLRGDIFIGPHGRMIKRSLFQKSDATEMPTWISVNEDLIMNLKLGAVANKIYVNNKFITYKYYFAPQGASKSKLDLNYWNDLFDIVKQILLNSYNYQNNRDVINAYYSFILNRMRTASLVPQCIKKKLLNEVKVNADFRYTLLKDYLFIKYPKLFMAIRHLFNY